jgi:hypothetical protein
VEFGVNVYRDLFGDKMESLYIRGSVPSGTAVAGWSDVDMFAIGSPLAEPMEIDWCTYDSIQAEFKAVCPFSSGLEIKLFPFNGLTSTSYRQIQFILSQSEHLSGPDRRAGLNPFRPIDVFFAYEGILDQRLKSLQEVLATNELRAPLVARWLGKELLRFGLILTIPRIDRYTTDLALCNAAFAKEYPNQAPEMAIALELVRHPQLLPSLELSGYLETFGGWLAHQYSIVATALSHSC